MNKTQLTAMQQFGQRIAQERRHKAVAEARDIGQKDVAEAAGVSESTVSRWEAGETMPREGPMMRLATYFGVTPAWLRYGQEPRRAETKGEVKDTRVSDERIAAAHQRTDAKRSPEQLKRAGGAKRGPKR